VACTIENELPWGTSWRLVDTFNARHVPQAPVYHLSLACNHCAEAPCESNCPALAYHKDPNTGAVLLDPERCIGCKYCTWACPYDAPTYDAKSGLVSKCTFCQHRQVEGRAPACVTQCPTGALGFGEIDSLAGDATVPGFPQTAADPSIRFVPSRGTLPCPSDALTNAHSVLPASPREVPAKTSLRSEAPLLVFSLVCTFLVGITATASGRDWIPWPVFLGLAALAASASTLHLGRKGRAWRAVLNWRRSWLSREILLFTAFAGLGFVQLAGGLPGSWGEWLVPLAGFATLLAIDRVYSVTATTGLAWHSARTMATGLMVAGLVAGSPVVFGVIALLKLLSYTARKQRCIQAHRPWRPAVSTVRVIVGLVLPLPLLLWSSDNGMLFVGIALAVGEFLDRAEFYLELEISTPAGQIQRELAARCRKPGLVQDGLTI
jgi:Fe-S-cluster-containing dehydrogenase component